MPKAKPQRCARCGARRALASKQERDLWNVELRGGVAVGYFCPACQTPSENAEAVVHEATLDYERFPDGRIIGRPKAD